MSNQLTHEQIEDLLVNVLQCRKVGRWKGEKISCCCPIHNEENPSFAIIADFKPDGSDEVIQSYNCLACGAHGSIPRLLTEAMPDKFPALKGAISYEAFQFLAYRYGVYYDEKEKSGDLKIHVKRYGEQNIVKEERKVLPKITLAGFRSGKETYKYFFQRGFTKEEMQEYMIGRDLEKKTVTIPVFWEDKELAGVIGRYVIPRPKEYRYEIYDFEKSRLLYPLDKFEPIDGRAILIEGQFDAILMRRWGYKNVLATMGGTISRSQIKILEDRCVSVVPLFDFDKGGEKALERLKAMTRKSSLRIDYLNRDLEVEGKDPSEWGEENTRRILENIGKVVISRI